MIFIIFFWRLDQGAILLKYAIQENEYTFMKRSTKRSMFIQVMLFSISIPYYGLRNGEYFSGNRDLFGSGKDRIREEKYLGKYGIRKRYIALDIIKHHEKKASYGNLFLGYYTENRLSQLGI